MDAATIHIIHDSAWVVVIFTLGMLVGCLLKVVMINRKHNVPHVHNGWLIPAFYYATKVQKIFETTKYFHNFFHHNLLFLFIFIWSLIIFFVTLKDFSAFLCIKAV